MGGKKIEIEKQVFIVKMNDKETGYLFTVKQAYALGVHRNTEASWYMPFQASETPLLLDEAMAISLRLAELGIRPPSIICPGKTLPTNSQSKVALMHYYVHKAGALKWYLENC